MGIRQNEGYAITDSFHLGEEEFVLGVHLKAANQYVTWRCWNQTDYYWGHYFQDLFAAQKDFAARIQEKITQMEEEKSVQVKTFPPPITSIARGSRSNFIGFLGILFISSPHLFKMLLGMK